MQAMPSPLIDAATVDEGLVRISKEIAARDTADVHLVGIRRGGEPIAQRLARLLGERTGQLVRVGSVDITLYRDDAASALPSPRIGPSHLPFDVAGKRVVLVDDVLNTGRTIRAALDALLDYGRPKRIELAVVVDRGGRELPIQADYVVARREVPDAWLTLEMDVEVHQPKDKMTLYLDRHVIKFFRAMGHGYQARINRVLETYLQMKIAENVNFEIDMLDAIEQAGEDGRCPTENPDLDDKRAALHDHWAYVQGTLDACYRGGEAA